MLATALALVELALAGPLDLQDGVRVLTVLVVSTLAVVLAALRERLELRTAEARSATRQAEETLALLDVIFARAPVGLAFYDLDGRYVRINDHLAEINGVPAGRAHRPHGRRDRCRSCPRSAGTCMRVCARRAGRSIERARCAARRRPQPGRASASGSRPTGPCARAAAAS